MRCVDINILIYAFRPESPDHAGYSEWLEAARRSDEPLGVPTTSLSGFVRVVTHPRIFAAPASRDEALEFAAALRASPSHLQLDPGPRHWEIFSRLCETADVRGDLVSDAVLAATAVEHGATVYSADRDFARFPELRWRHPLEGGPA